MKKNKPAHGVLDNMAWMLKMAWNSSRSVPFMCVVIALVNVGQSVLQLYAAPVILSCVEVHSALGVLLTTILTFTLSLMVAGALVSYLNETALFPRLAVRTAIMNAQCRKQATTSYPNTEDPQVMKKLAQASEACATNRSACEIIWKTLTELLKNLLCFAIYLSVLSGLHPAIVAVTLVTSVAGFFAEQHFHSWGYRHREERAEIRKELQYIDQTAHSRAFSKDLRIFGMMDWLKEVRSRTIRLYQDFVQKEHRVYLWADALEVGLSFLRNGFAYAVLLELVLRENLSAASFVLYFAAASGFSDWISGILREGQNLHRHSLELCQVREYLDTPEPFRMSGGTPLEVAPDMDCELRFDHVSFRYPGAEKDTIHDLDLTIRPGERLAIVGENGAGKTTLIKLLCGFYDPTGGRVLLNGRDIREFNRPDYYRLFSAVFQEYNVLAVTLRENITQTVGAYDEERMKDAAEKAGLMEKIDSIGWEAHLGQAVFEDGMELSGGQTQRLMLARALYKNGPVLVLDEPTAALDPIAENDIYQKYAAMTEGRTSVFISHRLASTRFCDRIILLDRGVIAEEGTHESLLAEKGAYAEMFNIQKKYYQEEAVQ